jgi:hypothetical protein
MFFLILLPHANLAQTTSGTINGTVVDRSGGAVPGAAVQLINQQTGVIVQTKSREHGEFVFPDLQPGIFTVVVDAPSYKQLRKVNLTLDATQVLSAGMLTLDVGEQSQAVTVSAEVTPIQLGSSERSDVLDEEQIGNLLTQGRDVMALLTTMPGVVSAGEANTLSVSTTPYINGVNNEYNMATVDGVSGNTRGYAVLDTPLNLDAIKEVTVMAANYQAQYGKTAGSSINLVTKNGTRQFHGSLYYYNRNEAFNANTYFNNRNGLPRARYRYNTSGVTIGGPVFWPKHFNSAKDKLFFFVSAEYDPNQTPEGIKYYVVPTALERKGDFSQSYNQTATPSISTLIRIKDPSSSQACAINSATPGPGCFANNQIPAGSINQAGLALLNIFPLPNMTNLAVSAGRYNYVTNTTADTPVNQEIFRIDYFPTQKLHMFFRGDLEKVNDNGYNSPTDPATWGLRVNYRTSNPNFVFNTTYAFSPSLLNELNLGTSGWGEAQLYDKNALTPLQQSQNGYNLGSLYPNNNPLNLVPSMSFGGISGAASVSWNTRFPIEDQVRDYSATDNLTWTVGRHLLKGGIDAQTDSYLQKEKTGIGALAFSRDTSNPYDSNYAYANAALGNFDSYAEVMVLHDFKPRTITLEWYTQDQWQITKRLTLDYGIRYSYDMAQHLAFGANFIPSLYQPGQAPILYRPTAAKTAVDPTTGIATYPAAYSGLYVPNTGSLSNGALSVNTPGFPQGTYYGNGLLVAPRVGFAWDPYGQQRTVIRGGYGIFYNVRPRTAQAGGMYANPPATFKPQQYYGSLNSFKDATGLLGPSSVGWALPLHPAEVSTENLSLGLQQMMGHGVVLDAAYVGTLGRHVSDFRNINEVPYGAEFALQNQSPAGGVLPDNFFRPYPGYATINLQSFDLTSNYNAMQVKVTRRFSHNLGFGLAYTWSKAMDYSDALNGTVAVYQDLRQWNYGPAGWDRRNNLTVNYIWSLPKGSRIWSNKVTRGVLDNWQISGIDSYISGNPGSFSLSVSNGANITGGGDGARVMVTGNPMQNAPHKFDEWFNTSVVQVPLAGQAATATTPAVQGQRGNAPKVNFYNPGYGNFNTALFKNFPLKGRSMIQFRLESYNTFNHSEFNGVDSAAVFANASSSTTPETSAGFGQMDSTAQPRYLQLALRINY